MSARGVVGALGLALGLLAQVPWRASTGRAVQVRAWRGDVAWIAPGEFIMGSDRAELSWAQTLCRREPFYRQALAVLRCLGPGFVQQGEPVACDREVFREELGRHGVWLAAYGLDRTEVTVADYARCVQSGACPAGPIAPGAPQLGGARQPAVGVLWTDAAAYCRWVGGRLPTEAEWERAARGTDGRAFPWGTQWDPRRANHGRLAADCHDAVDGHAFSAPVGSYTGGVSPEGVYDLAGNAWEWVADLWDDNESLHPVARQPVLRVAPTGASHGVPILRGGSYLSPPFMLRVAYRGLVARGAPSERAWDVGFRCAYTPANAAP